MSFENEDGATDSEPRRPPLPPRAAAPFSVWRRLRQWLLYTLALAGGAVIFIWLRDGDDGTPIVKSKSVGKPPIVVEGIKRAVIRDKGKRVWEFAAATITFTPDGRFAIATAVSEAIYYRDDKPYLQLQAANVRLNQVTFDAVAGGGVVAKGPEGVQIKTERALWTHRRRLLDCPGKVWAGMHELTVQTAKVLYDMPQNRLKCQGSIEVVGKDATLRGQKATVDIKSRLVEFEGGSQVVVRRPLR